jgi:glucose-1-phosphate cytidylyltransferase
MKVVILAGGLGTRLSEETALRPKPMVEIGGKPILWHIMKIYAAFGHKDFLVACGYKGDCIKEYFNSFAARANDYFIDLKTGSREVVSQNGIDWRIGLIDTGADTMTGGRILRLKKWLEGETFMVTYGDGVGNIDINALLKFHREHGKLATVTAVRPPARFGGLILNSNGTVERFSEKSQTDAGWINGGFFVFEPEVLDYVIDDSSILERETLERLASDGELGAYCHDDFWQPMDTLREKQMLEELWQSGQAPWATWSHEKAFTMNGDQH